MKLVTFVSNAQNRIGAVVGDSIVDLNLAYRSMLEKAGNYRAAQIAEAFLPADTVGFLEAGEKAMALAKEAIDFALSGAEFPDRALTVPFKGAKLKAPVTSPGKVYAIGLNYMEHIEEGKKIGRDTPPPPSYPCIFSKLENTVRGPQDPITKIRFSDAIDYEAELAFVIGRRCARVSEEDALSYIGGYTIANDVSYRDLQMRTSQWLQGKNADGAMPLGPWLVTSDEIPDPSKLDFTLTVNGELRQQNNTKNLIYNIPLLVSYISQFATMNPGDIVITGTCAGVASSFKPPKWLKEGDVVTITFEKIGTLENVVEYE